MSDTPIYDRLVIETGTEPAPLLTWDLPVKSFHGDIEFSRSGDVLRVDTKRLSTGIGEWIISPPSRAQEIIDSWHAPARPWWDVDAWEDDE